MADFVEESTKEKSKEEEVPKGDEKVGDDGDDDGAVLEVNIWKYTVYLVILIPVQEESTAVFTPLVHLEAVEVKTHEEDEDILFVK